MTSGQPCAFAPDRCDARKTMNITVRSYNELKPLTDGLPEGGRLALADGQTVGDALRRLALPPQKQTELVLFVNGRMAHPETRLADGDTLVFFSAIAGG
jgi:sulfur carrier protein ThiS